MAKKANWGGKRANSGVKVGEPVKRVTITLPVAILEKIDREAYAEQGGSRSALIARLLRDAL